MEKTSHRGRRLAAVLLAVLLVLAAATGWYLSDYYRAEEVATAVLAQGTGIDELNRLSEGLRLGLT